MASELLHGNFVGTVMKVDKTTRKLGVYIPKFMPALYNGDAKEEKFPTNNGLELNNITSNISNTVNKINYIWVNPKDKNEALPEVGSKVLVMFLDGTPSLSYWEKWNMNGDWETIPDEKYKPLFSMESGGREINIDEDDLVVMKFPDSFSITSSTIDKVKTLSVNENYDFYKSGSVSKVISDLQKSMEYLEASTKEAFIDSLQQYTIMTTRPERSSNETWPKPAVTDKTTSANYMKAIASTVDGKYTYYSTTDFYNIANDMEPYYEKLGAVSETTLTDDQKAQCDVIYSEAIKKLDETYYSTINQGIYDGFKTTKDTLVESIRSSDNLLDCDKTYKYGKMLLSGLKDIYTAYTKYKVKYDKEKLTKTLAVTDTALNTSIRTAFEQALDIADNEANAANFILYMKDMFPEKVKIFFVYSEDGVTKTRQNKEVCDVFGQFPDDWNDIVDNTKLSEDKQINFVPILTIPENTYVSRSGFELVGWKDAETNTVLSTGYSPVQTVLAEPQYFGCYILVDNNTYEAKLYIKNDLNSDLTLTATDKDGKSITINSGASVSDEYRTITISNKTKTITLTSAYTVITETKDTDGKVTKTETIEYSWLKQ